MIISWMAYSIAVALLVGGAAVGAERCLRLYGKPARWVWVIALATAVFLPLIGIVMPDVLPTWSATSPAMVGGTDFAAIVWQMPSRAVATNVAGAALLNQTILTLWITASLILALVFIWSAWRLRREVRSCAECEVGGIPILVSRDLGPAVVGLKREAIVLPSWVLDKDERERLLLTQHELEHVRVGDQRLLLSALLIVVLLPWNAAIWWFFSRVRLAVEADCDLRLLSSGVDLRTYSNLLLDVGARNGAAPIAALAFSRNRSSLFRRVQLMTSKPRRRFAQATLAAAATLLLAVLACETPMPPESADGSAAAPSLETANADLSISNNAAVNQSIQIRSNIGAEEPSPLVIVDGVIMGPTSDFKLEDLNPDTIERIEVLKGESAKALYGERAAGGIINIYLKVSVRSPANDSTGG